MEEDFKTYKADLWLTKEQRYQFTTDELKQWVLECLKDNYGIVTDAAARANISHTTIYNWKRSDADFKERFDEIQDMQIDFVERKMYDVINEKNNSMIQFFLRTRGKHRGYQESMVNHNINQDISIGFENDDDDDENIDDIIE